MTHVCINFNRSVDHGACRAQYFQPDAEFRVTPHVPTIRVYPSLRTSVWSDAPDGTVEEMEEAPNATGLPRRIHVETTYDFFFARRIRRYSENMINVAIFLASHMTDQR